MLKNGETLSRVKTRIYETMHLEMDQVTSVEDCLLLQFLLGPFLKTLSAIHERNKHAVQEKFPGSVLNSESTSSRLKIIIFNQLFGPISPSSFRD